MTCKSQSKKSAPTKGIRLAMISAYGDRVFGCLDMAVGF